MAGLVPIARYFNPTLEVQLAGVRVRFADGQGLTVRFRVERSMASTPDSASVEIINLDPLRAREMGRRFRSLGRDTVTIRAGYDGVAAGLFKGDLREFTDQETSGPDLVTKALADDGGDAIAEVPYRQSNVGLTAANMIDIATALMKITQSPSVASVLASASVAAQGPYTSVVTGKARDMLDAACRRLNCRWWVRDDVLYLGRKGVDTPGRPAVLLTDDTLVAAPSHQGSGLSSFQTLFDPNIVGGSQVRYKATYYRVEAVTHEGSTRGGLWVSSVEGRALT